MKEDRLTEIFSELDALILNLQQSVKNLGSYMERLDALADERLRQVRCLDGFKITRNLNHLSYNEVKEMASNGFIIEVNNGVFEQVVLEVKKI